MPTFTILINGLPVEFLSPLPPVITQFSVTAHTMLSIQIDLPTSNAIKSWLNQLIDKLDTEYVMYNNTLIPVKELVKF